MEKFMELVPEIHFDFIARLAPGGLFTIACFCVAQAGLAPAIPYTLIEVLHPSILILGTMLVSYTTGMLLSAVSYKMFKHQLVSAMRAYLPPGQELTVFEGLRIDHQSPDLQWKQAETCLHHLVKLRFPSQSVIIAKSYAEFIFAGSAFLVVAFSFLSYLCVVMESPDRFNLFGAFLFIMALVASFMAIKDRARGYAGGLVARAFALSSSGKVAPDNV